MRISTFILTGFLAIFGGLEAQAPRTVGDLELEIEIDIPPLTPPGSQGLLTLTVHNRGPEAVGTYPASTRDINIVVNTGTSFIEYPGFRLPDIVFSRADDEPDLKCGVEWLVPFPYPGEPAEVIFTFSRPTLDPGESTSCKLEYRIAPEAEGETLEVTWRTFDTLNDDPNPANNAVPLTFRLRAPPVTAIPTLSPAGLLVLVLSLFAAFVRVQARRRDGKPS